MNVTLRSACLWFATIAVLGCGSKAGSTYPDAQATDVGTPDQRLTDGATEATKPEPMSGGGNQLLYAGPANLLTNGPPCTAEAGATGDRWCAFTTPATLGFSELFVVNVSKAAAGVGISCGRAGGDPNCLLLTRGFLEETAPPAAHAALFQGDTLVYFDVTGTPYGWRPGMANGRALADSMGSLNVRNCFPAPKGTAVLCLRDISVTDVLMSDLLVGRIDGAANPPLARVETVISNVQAASLQRFQVGFPTADGDFVAWSSRATATGIETLKVQKVDDPATRRTVASDVFLWSTSPDGASWYWLSHYGAVMGDLIGAPFPDGAAPTTLIAGVHDYLVSRAGTVVALTGGQELQGIVDPAAAPAAVVSLDTGVKGLLTIGDRGQVAYFKTFDGIFPISDIFVKRVDGVGRTCTLTSQVDGIDYGVQFLPESAGVLWARVTTLNVPVGTLPPIDVTLTNLSDCSKTIVASRVSDGAWQLTGGNGVAFIDQSDGQDGTLQLRGIVGGNTLAPERPTLIQSRVDRFQSLFATPGGVLFTVNAGSSADGLYLHPLSGSVADGGAGDLPDGSPDGTPDETPDGGISPDDAPGE